MATPLLKPGDTLGKYEIVREVAIGGMAAIYLARVRGQAGFEKNVVLKCILPSFASDRALVQMFLDEARLAATLRHSNIADVFDVGTEGKHYYFAMEHVHGENARTIRLEAQQRRRPIPLEVSLAITLGTTAALGYAHDRLGPDGNPLELIHRDISPSNILVSFDGAIKLVDFGIARAASRNTKTRTGVRKGKVPYMSPEQCRGQRLDRRTDLFSLGTVVYELTVGRRPFLGSSDFEVMDAIVTADPPRPSELVPGYPAELERIVMRLLENSPETRYQSAHQVIDDIEAFTARSGRLVSAQMVSRFMRDLFESADLGGDTPTAAALIEDAPTFTFRASKQMLLTPKKPRRATTVGGVDDASVTSAFGEHTTQEAAPFAPIDSRSGEILEELDRDAPPGETEEERAFRHVEMLLQQADGWLAIGEPDKAVTSLELALDESAFSERGQELLQNNIQTIIAVYEGMLVDPYRVFETTRPPAELASVPMEDGARDLLAFIDGRASVREIIALSGQQRLEVYHHLCHLLQRDVIR